MTKDTFPKNINDQDLAAAIRCYFKDRYEFSKDPLFDTFLHRQVGDYAKRKRDYNRARNPNINPGLPVKVTNKKILRQFRQPVLDCAAKFYFTDQKHLKLKNIHVMIVGRTRPVRCILQAEGDNEYYTMYIKSCNMYKDPRPLGLELIRCIGAFQRDYHFCFDGYIALEKHIDGVLIAGVDEEIKKTSDFIEHSVEMQLTAMYMGLRDLHENNYVVQKNGVHAPIDFDVMGPYSTDPKQAHNCGKLKIHTHF